MVPAVIAPCETHRPAALSNQREKSFRCFPHSASTYPLVNKAILAGLEETLVTGGTTIPTVEVTKFCGFPTEHVQTTSS